MAGFRLRQVEVRARVKFAGRGPVDVRFPLDERIVRVFGAPGGYVVVVDDDYYNDHRVLWGDTLKDALDAYYEVFGDVEVLDAEVTGAEEDWEEEDEGWEEEVEEWEEELGIEEE
jgi:hypothetical protein